MTRSDVRRPASESALPWMGGLAAFVVSWRLLSVFFPHSATLEPLPLRIALTGLGLWFLACGFWAYRRCGGPAGFLFALYGLAAGLHWGGSVGLGAPRADTLLLVFYLVASTVAAETLFVHLALAFPAPFRLASRRGLLIVLYLPAAVGGPVLLALTLASSFKTSALAEVLPAVLSIGMLLGLAAVVVWVARLFTSRPGERPVRVAVALAITVVAQVATMTGQVDPDLAGWLNLSFALLPAAVTADLVRAASGARR